MRLRPYQSDLINRVRTAFVQHTRVVMRMPTGGGKTATAADIMSSASERGRKVLFLAHLDVLIEDTAGRLRSRGVHCGIIQADKEQDPSAPVQVASFQTLHARDLRPDADLVIVDECHRAMGPTVRAILESYSDSYILGLTATPQRGDGQPLGDLFEHIEQGPSVKELTAAGYLVPCDVLAPESGFLEHGLAQDPIDAYERSAPGTRALVFAADVEHARSILETARAHCIPAELLIGETDRATRAGIRNRVTSGQTKLLIGVGVFVEGFDLPAVETIILARTFSVTGSFLQAIGRGLRPYPGKTRCTIIDLKGSVYLHGLPDAERTWSLSGNAAVRTDKVTAVARCSACGAIFAPASKCPRCGAPSGGGRKIPLYRNRDEKLASLSEMPPHIRDAKYLARLEWVAVNRIKLDSRAAERWAASKFRKQFGRDPVTAPTQRTGT